MAQTAISTAAKAAMAQALYDQIFISGVQDATGKVTAGATPYGSVTILAADAIVSGPLLIITVPTIVLTGDATINEFSIFDNNGTEIVKCPVSTAADDEGHIIVASAVGKTGHTFSINNNELTLECGFNKDDTGFRTTVTYSASRGPVLQPLYDAIYTDGVSATDATLEYYEGTFPTDPDNLPVDAVLLASVTSAAASSSIGFGGPLTFHAPDATVNTAGTMNYIRFVNNDSGEGIAVFDVGVSGGVFGFNTVTAAVSDVIDVASDQLLLYA